MPKYVYLKLPVGVNPPNQTYVKDGEPRTTRGGTFQLYRKQVQVVNKAAFDDLSYLFGNMGVNTPAIGIGALDDETGNLEQLFGNLTMSGGKRKSRRTRRHKRRN